MQKIEIIRITGPDDFWIAEKHSTAFLDMIHNELKRENEVYPTAYEQLAPDLSQQSQTYIVAIYEKVSRKWFRGVIISKITSFNQSENFNCYLIDTGETLPISKNCCSRILNENLKTLPPLAKHCSLFGITPIHSKWLI